MRAQGMIRSLSGYLCTLFIVVSMAGCGGGGGNSLPPNPDGNTQTITAAITADPGVIGAVKVGNVVTLDGRGSRTTLPNTSNNQITYAWSMLYRPDGSLAELDDPTSPTPSFLGDVRGSYRIQLVVSVAGVSSEKTIALVEVSTTAESSTGLKLHVSSDGSYSSNCVVCHDGNYEVNPIPLIFTKSGDHPATSNLCQGCHTTFGFNLRPFVDHTEVLDTCSTCHNGTIAIGKSQYHQATTAECNECHDTVSFLKLVNGKYNHDGIVTGCSACHTGVLAIGKDSAPNPPGHPDTTSDCSYCHKTTGFLPAYPDHTGPDVVGKPCATCHNATGGGWNASNQPVGHPVMTRVDMTTVEDCGTCHSINGFNMGGVFPHRLIDPTVLQCKTCHNDDPANSINARGISSDPTPPHIPATLTATQDCAGCHSTTGFFPSFGIDHTEQAVIDQACNACHVADNSGSARGLPPSSPTYMHVPYDTSTIDCEACHAPPGGGTFATGYFDHVAFNVTNGCQTCHDDVIVSAKPGNHIPTTSPAQDDCVVCHQATVTNNFVDFTGGQFHANFSVTNNCQTCHDGTLSTGKSLGHIPTTPADQDCAVCHMAGTFVDFTDGYFDHTGVTNNCVTCHNGNYVTSGAIPKKVNHIPAQQECSQCHLDTTVTGGFMTTIFYSNVHTNLANGCEGCHKNPFLPTFSKLASNPNHLPTSQDCHFCHTNTITGGFTLGMSTFTHAGISGNCASCHDGNYTTVTPTGARGKTPSPPHPVTTADCGYCHSINGNFLDGTVDHSGPDVVGKRCDSCHNGTIATGKIDDPTPPHVPVPVVGGVEQDCVVCHVAGGTFKPSVFNHTGITNNCASCHDGSVSAVTVKPTNHPPTIVDGVDRDCSYCHNTTAFAGAKYDHTGITGNCVQCHNGNPVIGKTGTHVPTSEDCVVCHQTTGFKPAIFNHTPTQINGKRCDTCHNGIFATGKIDDPTPPHVTTTEDCSFCHNFNMKFSDAVFNHTGITSGCNASGCHTPTGAGRYFVTPTHVDPAPDCVQCHAVNGGFLDGKPDHSTVAPGSCASSSCHGPGGTGTQQPPNGLNGHFETTGVSCDACHTTTTWANQNTFDHCPGSTANNNACSLNGTKYPGDHRAGRTTCKSCHTTNRADFVSYPNQATYAPDCAGCHAGRFRRKGDHIGGENGTVAQNKDCSNGGRGCHRVNDGSF